MGNLIRETKGRENLSRNPVKIRFAGETESIKRLNDMLSRAAKEESLSIMERLLNLWRKALMSPSPAPPESEEIVNIVGSYIKREMAFQQESEKTLSCDLLPPEWSDGKREPFFTIEVSSAETMRECFSRLFPFQY